MLLATMVTTEAQVPHPADTNADFVITIEEVGAYYNEALEALTPEERNADAHWQQAHFIWTSGGGYEERAGLHSPASWLPTGGSYVSVLPRDALPFDEVTVYGLPQSPTVTGRYRPHGSTEWLNLDAIESVASGTYRFDLPYIPSPWMPSRWVEIELVAGGRIFNAGRVHLAEIARIPGGIEAMLEDTQAILGRYVNVAADDVALRVLADEPVGEADRQLAYYSLVAEHLNKGLAEWRRTSPNLDTDLELLIIDELFALNHGSAGAEGLTDIAAVARRGAAEDDALAALGIAALKLDKCETIKGWTDLILLTKARCKLEAAEADNSIKKKITSKVADKLIEQAQKLGERLLEDSKQLAKRATLPITLTLEIRDFINAWNMAMLPKMFTDLQFEFRDDDSNPAHPDSALLEDSPYASLECASISFKAFASIKSEGFSTAKFLLDSKLPKADDAGLPGLIFEDQIGKFRKQAIDSIYDEIKDYDLNAEPCEWKEIEIPHTRDDPKFELRSLTDVLVIDTDLPAGFKPGRVGTGTIEVKTDFP